MPILEVDDIHTYYGDSHVLHGLSLHLEPGQILGVLGRNGVGKTTLVSSVVGFTPPRQGCVRFNGEDITHVKSFQIVRRGIGLVPQGRRLFGSLTVEENLRVAEQGKGRRGWTIERVYGLFQRLGERRRQRARTLSGGEQQMLAIGRGLMTNPDCLVMDEPSEGLGPMIVRQVQDVIRRLKDDGMAILLVEQNAHMALQLVDHVLIMSKGAIVHSSSPAELSANEAVRAQYLGI
jgi:branched-chain amino acid transport system ATP-binding protein